nr:uncharacterized protein LOC109766901 [Aegilops tauschii subsp. strangulata]
MVRTPGAAMAMDAVRRLQLEAPLRPSLGGDRIRPGSTSPSPQHRTLLLTLCFLHRRPETRTPSDEPRRPSLSPGFTPFSLCLPDLSSSLGTAAAGASATAPCCRSSASSPSRTTSSHRSRRTSASGHAAGKPCLRRLAKFRCCLLYIAPVHLASSASRCSLLLRARSTTSAKSPRPCVDLQPARSPSSIDPSRAGP